MPGKHTYPGGQGPVQLIDVSPLVFPNLGAAREGRGGGGRAVKKLACNGATRPRGAIVTPNRHEGTRTTPAQAPTCQPGRDCNHPRQWCWSTCPGYTAHRARTRSRNVPWGTVQRPWRSWTLQDTRSPSGLSRSSTLTAGGSRCTCQQGTVCMAPHRPWRTAQGRRR